MCIRDRATVARLERSIDGKIKRMVGKMMNQLLHVCFNGWAKVAVLHVQRRGLVKRFLHRKARADMRRAIGTWHVTLQYREALARRYRQCSERLRYRDKCRAWNTWKEKYTTGRRNRLLISTALKRLRAKAKFQVFMRWMHNAATMLSLIHI